MIIFKHIKNLTKDLQRLEVAKKSIGFVPTMGALHEGHLSLLKECNKKAEVTVCSIFVNPTQFNNIEDLKKYPKLVSNDILLLEKNGCDILFLPDEKEIYPNVESKEKYFDIGYLESILEGKFRPGHFQGVSLVIEKLLTIVNPDFLFLGQKDFQQCLVIKRLISLMKKKIKLIICPILREHSGLAMSSRNVRLNSTDKKIASELYQSLISIKNILDSENFLILKDQAIIDLEGKGFKVEYLELAKKNNLKIVSHFKPGEEPIILIAAFLGGVRLIDNVLINP
jgi:pantoate--beta-alanine ligase